MLSFHSYLLYITKPVFFLEKLSHLLPMASVESKSSNASISLHLLLPTTILQTIAGTQPKLMIAALKELVTMKETAAMKMTMPMIAVLKEAGARAGAGVMKMTMIAVLKAGAVSHSGPLPGCRRNYHSCNRLQCLNR